MSAVRDVQSAVVRAPDGTTVRVQLLDPTGVAPWPVEVRELVQRYSDAPPARLRVPTAASFAAWKTIAWLDRAAARDLYDLWALAQIGAIDERAVDLFVRYGPTNRPPSEHRFAHPPDETRWRRDLAGQVQLGLTAAQALEQVRLTWRRAIRQQ